MNADAINILRAMADGRWRTACDAAIKSGVPEIKAQDALEALVADGRLIRERVNTIHIYRAVKGQD
jgi:hypothetical protein